MFGCECHAHLCTWMAQAPEIWFSVKESKSTLILLMSHTDISYLLNYSVNMTEAQCTCHVLCFDKSCFQVLIMFSGSLLGFQVSRFLLMFFPLSLSFTQVTCSLFRSCTSSLITSPQYLVSRSSLTLCKILTSLTVHEHASQVFATSFIHSIVHVCSCLFIVLFFTVSFVIVTLVLFFHSLVLFCYH